MLSREAFIYAYVWRQPCLLSPLDGRPMLSRGSIFGFFKRPHAVDGRRDVNRTPAIVRGQPGLTIVEEKGGPDAGNRNWRMEFQQAGRWSNSI